MSTAKTFVGSIASVRILPHRDPRLCSYAPYRGFKCTVVDFGLVGDPFAVAAVHGRMGV
jgi:hypothetical protein